MAHIHLIHNADDTAAAERIADVLYFLDYEVNLLTREAPEPATIPEDDTQSVILVLWTPSAQKDRWVTAQCRDLEETEQLITIVPKTPGSPALPLMLHRGCIIRLEHQSGRMRLATLQNLLAEIGRRSGRDGLVSGVAALLRADEEERIQALSQWVAANPDDSLAPTVAAVLESHVTHEIHNALVEVTDNVITTGNGFMEMAGGVAEKVKLPTQVTPMMYYAAIAVIAAGAFLATLLPIINRPTETVEIERIEVPAPIAAAGRGEISSDPNSTSQVAMLPEPEPDPLSSETDIFEGAKGDPLLDGMGSDTDLDAFDYADAGEFPGAELEAVGDVEAEYEIVSPARNALSDDRETLGALEDTLGSDVEEPSLGVPDPDEALLEPVVAPVPDQPSVDNVVSDAAASENLVVEDATAEDAPAADAAPESVTPEDAASDEETVDLTAAAPQAELLLPYIRGEQRPGDAFTDRLSDETGAPIMVVIPPGSFMMGSPLTERGRDISEGPQRSVSMGRSFAVSKYEITVAEFEKFVAATDYDIGEACQTYANDSWGEQSGITFRRTGFNQSPNHPATCIDWYGAKAYAEWLSEETGAPYRLLSESEWEYAARAGSEQAYPFGTNANEGCGFLNGADESAPPGVSSSLALDCSDGVAHTAHVGTYLPNRFGLYDMHGNVWEWTQDTWHTSYDGAPRSSRAWDSGQSTDRVVRGGSWFSVDFWLRSASRRAFQPSDRRYDLGFRVARDL